MREHHLAARPKKRPTHTTRQGNGRWRAPDLIGRDFPASTLNQKWYGDGTEIATDDGKRFLDSLLDMGWRRILGFALDKHHDAELAHAALAMTVAVRGGTDAIAGVIMHSSGAASPSVPRRLHPHRDQTVTMLGGIRSPILDRDAATPGAAATGQPIWLGSMIRRGRAFDDLHPLVSSAHRPIAGSEGS